MLKMLSVTPTLALTGSHYHSLAYSGPLWLTIAFWFRVYISIPWSALRALAQLSAPLPRWRTFSRSVIHLFSGCWNRWLSSYICPGIGLDLSLVPVWILYFFPLKCCRSFGVCLCLCRSIELCLGGRGWKVSTTSFCTKLDIYVFQLQK